MRTLIIAEAGVNHNGDLALARELVDAAADAGADLVKFQTFQATKLATAQARKAVYQSNATGADEAQIEMLKRLELDRGMHEALVAHCAKRGIGFFSTAFDLESLELLVALGADRFKIPSGEITNLPYLRRVGSFGKPVLLSTGMATMREIADAVRVLEESGASREVLTVLHCTTEYPTPMAEVNLRAMLSIRDELGMSIGYSDHTRGIEVAIAAVALGAGVIEKHFTLNRSLPGPDHAASLEPAELNAMVRAVRNIELALGDGVKQPTPSERRNAPIVRKSIVAARPIRAGEAFSAANLTTKRPGTGVSPMFWDRVIGRPAPRDFAADELIEL